MKPIVETLRWVGDRPGHVEMVDQTRLPEEHVQIAVRTVDEMREAIRRLAVRGAPAIGVAAGYGVLLGVQELDEMDAANVVGVTQEVAATLAKARPTAVNLFWALDRMRRRAESESKQRSSGARIVEALFEEARAIHAEDRAQCRAMGEHGADLLKDGARVLTHCNAGALATGGMGTALAPIYVARERGVHVKVFADETRPLLQGARLTAWELHQAGVDVTLITDNMAASLMARRGVDIVLVGSDRIARNGDVCNKIGTYGVAVLAREHGVPFYAVAPLSTFDPSIASGAEIPIEERAEDEVTHGLGRRTAPVGVKVWNPAFDVTPARLVTGIVTEVGIITPPSTETVVAALERGGVLVPAPSRRS
jgi:methylthioribose-1-phosphate isomerase